MYLSLINHLNSQITIFIATDNNILLLFFFVDFHKNVLSKINKYLYTPIRIGYINRNNEDHSAHDRNVHPPHLL